MSEPKGDKGEKKGARNRRRRGRELALQALFTLDHQKDGARPEAIGAALYRIRERALAAELECVAADGERDDAKATAEALLRLDGKHALALEAEAWLAGKGPRPLAPTADERVELEAVRGGLDELAFCETIVRGVAEHREAIDKILADSSTNWRVARMAVVDRNILRMGVFELQHLGEGADAGSGGGGEAGANGRGAARERIPARVTLNEAIEIGKRYGTSESGAFINGILDKIAGVLGATSRDARDGRDGRDGRAGGKASGHNKAGRAPGDAES